MDTLAALGESPLFGIADAKKAAFALSKTEFFCEADARSAADPFFSVHPLVQGNVLVEERRSMKGGRGHPAPEAEMEIRYRAKMGSALAPDAVETL